MGLSLVSSVVTEVGRTPSLGTRRSGPFIEDATGPAASASGKLAPEATVTMNCSPEYCGWKADCEMATAVAYRSAPARRVKVVDAACAPAGATRATAVERARAEVRATRVVMGSLRMAGSCGAQGVRSSAAVGAAAR